MEIDRNRCRSDAPNSSRETWNGGAFADRPAQNLETWFVPGGSATAMLYTFKQPGLYAYLNHNLIEAFALGAAAHVQVKGTWNDDLMKQVKQPGPIQEP